MDHLRTITPPKSDKITLLEKGEVECLQCGMKPAACDCVSFIACTRDDQIRYHANKDICDFMRSRTTGKDLEHHISIQAFDRDYNELMAVIKELYRIDYTACKGLEEYDMHEKFSRYIAADIKHLWVEVVKAVRFFKENKGPW